MLKYLLISRYHEVSKEVLERLEEREGESRQYDWSLIVRLNLDKHTSFHCFSFMVTSVSSLVLQARLLNVSLVYFKGPSPLTGFIVCAER